MRRVTHVLSNARAADGKYYEASELKAIAAHRWCGTSINKLLLLAVPCLFLNGCFLLVVGAGEAGYVAGQKDKTTGEAMTDQWIFTKVSSKIGGESRSNRAISRCP